LTGYLLDRFLALKYLASSTFDAKYISHSALRNKYSTEDEYADYKDEVADYKNKVADYKDEEVDNEDETTNDEDTAVNLRLTDASHIQHDTDMSENSRRIRRSLCQRKSRVVGNSKGRQ
jgi:CRISPR/Cas system CSM-associated protein Csm4 (group 5 of RAMP superfamily)